VFPALNGLPGTRFLYVKKRTIEVSFRLIYMGFHMLIMRSNRRFHKPDITEFIWAAINIRGEKQFLGY
jgi:hypothetical protein